MTPIETARQLIEAMHRDPEIAAEVRRAVLTDELLALPEVVRRLADAVDALSVRQARLEESQARLEESQARLEESQARLEESVARLIDAALRTEGRLDRLEADVAELKGAMLEMRFSSDPRRYIPRALATRVRLMSDARFEDVLGRLEGTAADDVQFADALVEAEWPGGGGGVVLVVEASWRAHIDDVERAARRAGLVQESGVSAAGVVVSRADPADAVLDAALEHSVAVVSESRGVLVPRRPSAA